MNGLDSLPVRHISTIQPVSLLQKNLRNDNPRIPGTTASEICDFERIARLRPANIAAVEVTLLRDPVGTVPLRRTMQKLTSITFETWPTKCGRFVSHFSLIIHDAGSWQRVKIA